MAQGIASNPLRRDQTSAAAFGIYVTIASPAVVELAGLAGLDFVRIDCAHGQMTLGDVENMVRAAEAVGVTPMVRLELHTQQIASVLDMGATGIVVPGVCSADQARAVVDAAKFAPVGRRGMFSAARKTGYGSTDAKDYREWTNREVLVGIQVETLEAVDNLEAIVAVPGIDVVQSGRGDLANALDLPGQKDHPEVMRLENRIFTAARARGLAISPQLDPLAQDFPFSVEDAILRGARIISLGADIAIMKRAFASAAQAARTAEGGVSLS